MTNFIQTDQTRSKCAESASLKEAVCQNDDDCRKKIYIPNISGQWTGRCLLPLEEHAVNITENITRNSTGVCEMEGRLFEIVISTNFELIGQILVID
jgi:hypothetical protein